MRSLKLWFLTAAVALLAGCGGGKSVVLPPLSAVVVNLAADTIAVSSTAQFSATAYDLSSNPVSNVPFVWTSSDPSVFTVSGSGVVTGRGEGEAQLFVEAGGQRDTADILVLPAVNGWFLQTSNSSRQLNDVFFFPNARHGIVVGASGEVLSTRNAGDTWDRWISGTAFELNAVWFTSDSVGFAVGVNGTVLKSTTGGRTWTLVPSGSSDNLLDVYFASALNGWAVGSNGVVLRTIDGGANWAKQYITVSSLNGVSFDGAGNGWAVGNGGVIYGSHDGGVSWYSVQPAVTAQNLRAVTRRSEASAFAVGAQGVAPRTFAGPDSTVWQLQSAGAANDLDDVSMISALRGWAAGDNGSGIIVTTVDGGTNWTPQTAPAGNALHGVWFVDALRGWAVGDNGRILHTGNGGQ